VQVDVEYVRRAVRTIGRCAIKLEVAAERCIKVLLQLIATRVNYVVQVRGEGRRRRRRRRWRRW